MASSILVLKMVCSGACFGFLLCFAGEMSESDWLIVVGGG
jgi:hypothetical protein